MLIWAYAGGKAAENENSSHTIRMLERPKMVKNENRNPLNRAVCGAEARQSGKYFMILHLGFSLEAQVSVDMASSFPWPVTLGVSSKPGEA
jgi:hypothetical protein